MKRSVFFLFLFVLNQKTLLKAQTSPPVSVPQIIQPSPEAASLAKYGDLPVGMFTGHPDITIPLYQVKTKHLSVPISLNYNVNGIKVNELSSNVGMSWALNCGGVISRTVYGFPDFGAKQFAVAPSTLSFSVSNPDGGTLNWLNTVATDPEDTQPDAFNFNFNGYSGKFFIIPQGPIGSITYKVVMAPYSNINIQFDLTRNDWNFIATTPDGVKYYFGGVSATESVQTIDHCGSGSPGSVPTAWYLTKIQHPFDMSDSINFSYISTNYQYMTSMSQVETYFDATTYHPYFLCGVDPNIYAMATATIPYEQFCTSSSQVFAVYLQKITDSKYNQILFDYVSKSDANGGYLLSHITVNNNQTNRKIHSFTLNYQTASPVSTSNTSKANNSDASTSLPRPFLMGIDELDSAGIVVKPYKFGYIDFSHIPNRMSFQQDYWGYYNGVSNYASMIPLTGVNDQLLVTSSLIANRNPDYSYASVGLLNKITYPTGGYTTIEYEGNTKNTSYTGANSPSNFTTSYTYAQTVTVSSTTTSYQTFTVSTPMTATLIAEIDCNCPSGTGCPTQSDTQVFGSLTGTNSTNVTFNFAAFNARGDCSKASSASLTLQPGVQYALSILSIAPYQFSINLQVPSGSLVSVAGRTVATSQALQYTGGGMRVKRVVSFDPVAANTSIKRYLYDSTMAKFPVQPTYYHHYTHYEQGSDGYPCVLQNAVVGASFHQFSSNSFIDVFGQSSSPVYYQKVTESFGDNFENGGIEHNYSFSSILPISTVLNSPVFSANPPQLDWRNGLELSSKYFKITNGAQTYVQTKTMNYQVDPRNSFTAPVYVTEKVGNVQPGALYSLQVQCFNAVQINYLSEWQYLSSDSVQDYDVNGNPTFYIKTNYYYDNATHALLSRVETTDSRGILNREIKRYPQDNAAISSLTPTETTALSNLVSQGRIGEIVEDEKDKNSSLVQRVHKTFNSYTSSLVLPQNIQLQNGQGGASYIAHNFDNYSPTGDVLQMTPQNGIPESYIWDYKNNFPIGKVTNSVPADIAFTSFEADGSGNWNIPSGTRDQASPLTGNYSYSLVNGAITKTGLTIGKIYIVSYWAKGSSCTISGGTGSVKTGRSVSPWTYYEHTITATATTFSISGVGNIDELRLYPLGSQMTSYTYAPLIGMTTMNDPNSEIVYYEYDNFQRLLNIKDYQGSIIKNYQYNYAQPCTTCALPMKTFASTPTISYPVGVFSVTDKLLGNVTNQTQYINVWNANTDNSVVGTLSAGTDSMHFILTLKPGQTSPGFVTGCRFWQFDLPYTQIDAIRNNNGVYVDYGDGTGMFLGKNWADSNVVRAPNTVLFAAYSAWRNAYFMYWIHSYPSSATKTLTFYHNDAGESMNVDNVVAPASSLMLIQNLRGNLPLYTPSIGGNVFQQASANTVAGITNWNSINSITDWSMTTGDYLNPCLHVSYAQDFMVNNRNLQSVTTTRGYYLEGYEDLTFKITRLKSDWNTYFTGLKSLVICDDHWNRESLSSLINLNTFVLVAGNQNHSFSQSGNPLVPIPTSVIDNVFIQISKGAGRSISNGQINIYSGGTSRTTASDAAVAQLKSIGWSIIVNNVLQ